LAHPNAKNSRPFLSGCRWNCLEKHREAGLGEAHFGANFLVVLKLKALDFFFTISMVVS